MLPCVVPSTKDMQAMNDPAAATAANFMGSDTVSWSSVVFLCSMTNSLPQPRGRKCESPRFTQMHILGCVILVILLICIMGFIPIKHNFPILTVWCDHDGFFFGWTVMSGNCHVAFVSEHTLGAQKRVQREIWIKHKMQNKHKRKTRQSKHGSRTTFWDDRKNLNDICKTQIYYHELCHNSFCQSSPGSFDSVFCEF